MRGTGAAVWKLVAGSEGVAGGYLFGAGISCDRTSPTGLRSQPTPSKTPSASCGNSPPNPQPIPSTLPAPLAKSPSCSPARAPSIPIWARDLYTTEPVSGKRWIGVPRFWREEERVDLLEVLYGNKGIGDREQGIGESPEPYTLHPEPSTHPPIPPSTRPLIHSTAFRPPPSSPWNTPSPSSGSPGASNRLA